MVKLTLNKDLFFFIKNVYLTVNIIATYEFAFAD